MTTTTPTPAPAVFIPAQRTSGPGPIPAAAVAATPAGPDSSTSLVVPGRATPAGPIVPDPHDQATRPAEPALPRTPAQRRAYAIEIAACGSYDLLVDVATAHITHRTNRPRTTHQQTRNGDLMRVGQRVQLTTSITTLGNTALAGEQGHIDGIHADGYLTVRMDNGRTQLPHQDETTPVPDPSNPSRDQTP